jgi:bacterioferritin
MAATKQQVIEALTQAYTMEVETVINYLANSLHLEGVRAEAIKTALAADIQEELTHAQQFGNRIKQLGGAIPGSLSLKFGEKHLQPPADTTDVVAIIKGVIAAEEEAIRHYKAMVKLTQDDDFVTEDLARQILGQEEAHRQQFEGYLKEYMKG